MTLLLSGEKTATRLAEKFPGSIVELGRDSFVVNSEFLLPVATHIKNTPELELDFLASITAVDYDSYFEVVYHLTSLKHNHSLVMKTRCYDRSNPHLPSVVSLWRGADFQEREIYDLIGISFDGHPNMRRIFLWDSFQGHPLRRDYL